MAQSARMKEMEGYIKKVGELLNVVYKKATDVESKIGSLESEIAKLREDVNALKAENARLREDAISKGEYEEFMNRLVDGLKGLLTEAPERVPEGSPSGLA